MYPRVGVLAWTWPCCTGKARCGYANKKVIRRGTLGGTQYRNTVRKNGKYQNTVPKIV